MKFSDELIKILDDLGKRIGIAIDWTAENVMPYLQELCSRLITYKIVTQCITIVTCSILLIILILCIKKIISKYKECSDTGKDNVFWEDCCGTDPTLLGLFSMILIGVAFLVFAIVIPCTISELIQTIFLPELTIIEYVKQLPGIIK